MAENNRKVNKAVPKRAVNVGNTVKKTGAKALNKVDGMLSNKKTGHTSNYTGDKESERDYRPVRQSQEYRSGCLGGIMYFVFIVCCSIILAVFAWMAATDALALNKDSVSAVISLPSSIFTTKTVDVEDEDGNVTGTKDVLSADITYVSSELKSAGIIEYKWLFETFCKLSKADIKIDPGTYELKSTLDYRAIIKNMQAGAGAAVTVDVMIPEGFSMYDIFTLLEEEGVSSFDELMEAAADYSFNYSFIDEGMAGDASRLEGYLFPDTYQFYVGMQASSAINKLLNNFNNKWNADLQKQAADMGRSMKDIITIASLIEKEAAVDAETGLDERSEVASVIYNRLASDMSLGLESSVLYLYPDHKGAPTAEMLAVDSPYNTNINVGLPPTPICNPSLASIRAALNPADTNYYFFYYDSDAGFSKFFTNYDDFLAFVGTKTNEES